LATHSSQRSKSRYFSTTEHYSVLSLEVCDGPDGRTIANKNTAFIDHLLEFDSILVAGQARSRCVAWSVQDLLDEVRLRDPTLAGEVYLMEDCMSPVAVPDGVDFTDAADGAFARFAEAGMHRVRSTDVATWWPGGQQ